VRRLLDVEVARATASFVRRTTPAEVVLVPPMAFLDDPICSITSATTGSVPTKASGRCAGAGIWPQPMTEVLISPASTTLLLSSGEAGTISRSLFVDPTPCAETHTVCNVDLEPRG
jgi:hypothetical protein